jgi:hypothetical protein
MAFLWRITQSHALLYGITKGSIFSGVRVVRLCPDAELGRVD